MKKIAIIPTLLTLGNAVCGLAAITFASKITLPSDGPFQDAHFFTAAAFIFLAMLFDAVDGYAARLSKTASDFGGQLDSLCDAISFGLAPAFLMLRMGLEWQVPVVRQAMAVIAALYMICAILRLARFNVENSPDPASHKRFKGLPSPAAAGCVASLALFYDGLSSQNTLFLDAPVVQMLIRLWVPLGTLLVALLMVSRFSYPHLTKQLLRGRRNFSHLVKVILIVAMLAFLRELALVPIFWGYALSSVTHFLYVKLTRRDELPRPAGLEEPRQR